MAEKRREPVLISRAFIVQQYMGSSKTLQRKVLKPILRFLKQGHDLFEIYPTPREETRTEEDLK